MVASLAVIATYCLLKLTSECTEALSVSVEGWIEVQGKEEESTVDRKKLPMNVKLVLQQLGPQMPFDTSLWGLS